MAKKKFESMVSQMGRMRELRNDARSAPAERTYVEKSTKSDKAPADFQRHKLANLSGDVKSPAGKK